MTGALREEVRTSRPGLVEGLDVSCVSTGVPLAPFRTSP
jgi:hypothetical protein